MYVAVHKHTHKINEWPDFQHTLHFTDTECIQQQLTETQTCCNLNNLGFTFPTEQVVWRKVAFAFAAAGLQCQGHDFCDSPICLLRATRWLLLLQASHSHSGQEEGKRGDVSPFHQEDKRLSQKPSNRRLCLVGLTHIVWLFLAARES